MVFFGFMFVCSLSDRGEGSGLRAGSHQRPAHSSADLPRPVSQIRRRRPAFLNNIAGSDQLRGAGLGVCAFALRRAARIIMTTAVGDSYLTKPIDLGELLNQMRSCGLVE
jgi:hypothetical protein